MLVLVGPICHTLLLLPLLPAAHRSPLQPPPRRPPTVRPPLTTLAAGVRSPPRPLSATTACPVIGAEQCLARDEGGSSEKLGVFLCGLVDQISGAGRHIQTSGILFWGSIGFEVAPWRPAIGKSGGGAMTEVEARWRSGKNKIDGDEGLEGGRECSQLGGAGRLPMVVSGY